MKYCHQDKIISSNNINLVAFIAAIFLCMAIHMPVWAEEAPQGQVVHVVVMWFKDGGMGAQRQQVIDVTRGFKEIPGVLDIRVGETMQVDGGIDNSFSVGMYIVLENEAALDGYMNHPIHLAAKQSGLLDGLERMVVYNFTDK